MLSKKYEMRAVHDYRLDEFLENIGLLEALEKGELRCSICGCRVDRDNFQCAYSFEGQIEVCCDKLECFRGALSRRKTKVG